MLSNDKSFRQILRMLDETQHSILMPFARHCFGSQISAPTKCRLIRRREILHSRNPMLLFVRLFVCHKRLWLVRRIARNEPKVRRFVARVLLVVRNTKFEVVIFRPEFKAAIILNFSETQDVETRPSAEQIQVHFALRGKLYASPGLGIVVFGKKENIAVVVL